MSESTRYVVVRTGRTWAVQDTQHPNKRIVEGGFFNKTYANLAMDSWNMIDANLKANTNAQEQ